jgi:hypothetical protein
MVSSKDQAKKISQVFRQDFKKFFEDFYAKEEQAGRYPDPLEAAAAFARIFDRACEEYATEEWPPRPPDRPETPREVWDLAGSRLGQEAYREAVDAWYRHTPGLEIKKGKPGRPRKDGLAMQAAQLKNAGLSYAQIARRLNQEHGQAVVTRESVRKLLSRVSKFPAPPPYKDKTQE